MVHCQTLHDYAEYYCFCNTHKKWIRVYRYNNNKYSNIHLSNGLDVVDGALGLGEEILCVVCLYCDILDPTPCNPTFA